MSQQLSAVLIVMQSQVISTAKAISPPNSRTIVIIGAGFSGTVLASRLLRTDAHCAVIGTNNQAHPHLFYIGPMLRAAHWEATAVPELRGHAERLATLLGERHQQWATQ